MAKTPSKKDAAAKAVTDAVSALTEKKEIRCTDCGAEFAKAETEGVSGCPKCGSKNIPCLIAEDVELKINWHELRILTMWAENWALKISKEYPDAVNTHRNIIKRLEKQFPLNSKLSLRGEIAELKQEYPEIELRRGDGSKVDLDGEN